MIFMPREHEVMKFPQNVSAEIIAQATGLSIEDIVKTESKIIIIRDTQVILDRDVE